MAFSNNIQFILGEGGLNTPQPGTDYISGIVFKASTAPTGISFSTPVQLFSVANAESYGIYGDYRDETAATSLFTVAATGSAGDTVLIKVIEPSINSTYTTVTIGTYTITSSDTTNNTLANNISAFINTNFASSGYRAAGATGGSFSMTARVGLGTIINSTTPTITNTGTVNVSAAAFSGGVNSVRAAEHYQISEFFRMNPNGVLWTDYETSYGSFTCINSLQSAASNQINQVGLFNSGATTSAGIASDTTALQAVATTLFGQYAPLVVIYSPNIYATSDLSTLPNVRTYTNKYVSVHIGQDGGALGAHLSLMYGTSVPSYGALLGAISLANVAEDIGWVQKFNISNGTELEVAAFSNRSLYNTLYASSFNLLSQLDAYGYIFDMKRPNLTGTWFNDSNSAITITSDYAYIERNRVINKASRFIYQSLAPMINGGLVINEDGTLTLNTIANIKNAVAPNMDSMVTNGNISAYRFTVDPRQDVLSTSVLQVSLAIIPIGIARQIVVTLGFTTRF